MRLFSATILLLISAVVYGQSSQEKYLSAKSYFKNDNYSSAITAFAPLAADPVFGSYATFYLGLSYVKAGNANQGIDAWKQLLVKYPTFSQVQDVHLWITKTLFDHGKLIEAVKNAEKLEDEEWREGLYRQYLTSVSFSELRKLFEASPDDRELGALLVQRAAVTELSQSDRFFIEGMTSRLGLTSVELGQFPDLKKDSYSVAVFLPFLFDGLDNPDRTLRNSVVMDLYQGILLGRDMLLDRSIDISIFPFDTRRDANHLNAVLKNKDLDQVDAILGPLFPETTMVVQKFAEENKVNQVNPVSSNSEGLSGNPFSFILKPDYETMAMEAAEFMASTGERCEAKIYFENKPMEKALAKAYKEAIEKKGYEVSDFLPIDNKSARQVLAQFTDQEEVVLNITEEEYLLILEEEETRQVRDREMYDASGNLILNEDGSPQLEYYELVFTADTDSLDHLFAATRSNLLANNFVGAVEAISDTVRLLGLGEWLEFSMLDYKQLERLGTYLIHPEYHNRNSLFFKEIQEQYLAKYGKHPGEFALLGFEGIWWIGNMLNRHGKYFQNGFFEENRFESVLMGHRFVPGKNDNQVVPIVRFKDQELKAINLTDDNREE